MSLNFTEALRLRQSDFGLELDAETIESLAAYHAIVMADNELLHLVAPCPDEEFAVRHILESLTLLEFLPPNATFADVGPGAGLPSIPCVIARPDLRATLVESKVKKVAFLSSAVEKLGIADRVQIVNRQFEEVERPIVSHVTCRALDKFKTKLPRLVRWSRNAALLFFGGPALREELVRAGLKFSEKLMPMSEQRYLFIVEKRAPRV